ncbi:MAG: type VI secretion system baseplate subunit TssK [Legionellales bacterium]|nr:type VI secretion system baseplate subunit TssK [Legionellales bacterium]
MLFSNRIVWYEGMFLHPQHFQQQERYFENIIQQKITVNNENFWGLQSFAIDENLLSIGKIALKYARGIFPDGTYFDLSTVDQLPVPLDIPENIHNKIIYLTIPLREKEIAEVGTNETKQIHRNIIFQSKIEDAIADSHNEVEIQMAKLACSIMPEYENLSAYSILPIAKIIEVGINRKILLDNAFETIWINCQTSKRLSSYILEIYGLVENRAELIANRLTDENHAGTAEMVDFLLLQMMNKYQQELYYISQKRVVHPEYLYQVLNSLMAEISTYISKKRRPIKKTQYRHDNLNETFKELMHELRTSLTLVLEQNAINIKLIAKTYGTWIAHINDKKIINECQFVLVAYADISIDILKASLPNQLKIASTSHIETLIHKALPGANISPINLVPKQIPFQANHAYFLIDTASSHWKNLEKTGALAVHVGKKIPGLKLSIWAIKGNTYE